MRPQGLERQPCVTRVREEARISGEAIADEEDRLYFMRWLEGGNWHGLQERR